MVLLFVISIPFLIAFITSSSLNPILRKQNQDIFNEMEAVQQQPTPSQAILTEVTTMVANTKYDEAQQKIQQTLSEAELQDSEKRTLFTKLGYVCLQTEDLACLDQVVAEYGGLVETDYFTLNDAAELADIKKDKKRAKSYYQKLLSELDAKGGQAYADELNKEAEKGLDYQLIKDKADK